MRIAVPREVEIPFVVETNYAGWRLDRYLQEKLKRASRSLVQRLIREKLVHDGDRVLKPATLVHPGLAFRLRRPERLEPAGLPETLPVLYEDERLVVVNKPAGLPVHPTARYFAHTVTSLLARDFGRPRPDPVHRLDRETSGVLVCTKDPRAAREVELREKTYLALVEGHPDWDERIIEHALALTGEHAVRIRMSVVDAEHPGAQRAVTHVRVLERRTLGEAPVTLVECELDTGRQHQIRAHLCAEGHPVVGDKIYGADERIFIRFTEGALTDEDRDTLRFEHHALHAWRVVISLEGREVEVRAEAPDELTSTSSPRSTSSPARRSPSRDRGRSRSAGR